MKNSWVLLIFASLISSFQAEVTVHLFLNLTHFPLFCRYATILINNSNNNNTKTHTTSAQMYTQMATKN